MPGKHAQIRDRQGLPERLHAHLREAVPPELLTLVAAIEKQASDPAKLINLSIRVAALCTIATLVVSHALWFQDNRLYAPAPVFAALGELPHGLNAFLYGLMLILSGVLFIFSERRKIGFILPPVFLLLATQDQLRGQFSLYMFMFNFLVAACLPKKLKDKHADPLRYMIIGVYFWAGLYKINRYFIYALFPWFIAPWFPFHGLAQMLGWTAPLVESAIGLCLFFPRTRWIGQLLACLMLLVVILSIGPFGHNQVMGVWPINFYIDGMAVLLFMGGRPLWAVKDWKKPLPALSIFLFALLPAAGGLELIGHHPSFKLYCCAGHGEIQFAKGEDLSFLPGPLPRRLSADNRLSASSITGALFEIGASPLVPGDQAFLDGMRGFCPYLKKPQGALARVGDLAHFWSDEIDERVYAICDPAGPRLVCSTKDTMEPETGLVGIGACKAPPPPE